MAAEFADGLGLEKLHTPDHGVVDICFIHGLGGGRISTWKKDLVLWPYNLLPRDIKDARMITWGYDAEPAHFLAPTSSNRVRDHATSLFTALSSLRISTKTENRPIIFVAHSLGGIVCAQSLLQADLIESAEIKLLSEHTGGLVFMGTPFGGSDTTKWTAFFTKLSELSHVGKVNKELLGHLKTDSHDLKILGEEFPKWLNNRTHIHVTCFFEELAMPVVGMVVPRESACIPGKNAFPLSTDHVNICKFGNFQDPNYKIVCGTLNSWVEEIKKANAKEESDAAQNTTINMTGKNFAGTQTGQDYSRDKMTHNANTLNFSSKEVED